MNKTTTQTNPTNGERLKRVNSQIEALTAAMERIVALRQMRSNPPADHK